MVLRSLPGKRNYGQTVATAWGWSEKAPLAGPNKTRLQMSRKHRLVRSTSFCSGPLPTVWTATLNTLRAAPRSSLGDANILDTKRLLQHNVPYSQHSCTHSYVVVCVCMHHTSNVMKMSSDQPYNEFNEYLKKKNTKRCQDFILSLKNKYLLDFRPLNNCA